MTRSIGLLVNKQPVELDYFVQGFIDHTLTGMMEALEGTGEIKVLNISISGSQLNITINGSHVSTNPFVTSIVGNTIKGMLSSLKGVVGKIEQVDISVEK